MEANKQPLRRRGAFYQHISFSIPTERVEEFRASARILTDETAKEAGSINFFFASDPKNETDPTEGKSAFFLYEEWQDDASLEVHKGLPHFDAEFTKKIATYWVFGTFAKGCPL